MDRDDVVRWVAEYERGWRAGDLDAVPRLFSEDARYRVSPYADPPKVGHAEIQAFWRDDEGIPFTVSAEPVAVEGRDAVVRLEVRYGDPVTQEYRDLWVLRFADDGRVEAFEEWAYWPGKPYTASGDAAPAAKGGVRVRRVTADLEVADIPAAKAFYTDYLGLSTVEFDLGWVARFTSPDTGAHLQLVTRDASAPENPVISLRVDDVDGAHARARELGYEIVHPLTTEAWGVRRFFVRAPDGNVVNVVRHRE
ncbi:VOC family protein [Geodermatophilus sp. SYSU D00691]